MVVDGRRRQAQANAHIQRIIPAPCALAKLWGPFLPAAPDTFLVLSVILMSRSTTTHKQQVKREMIMTAEQAKTVKVQKGYVLEPVVGAGLDDENLPEKRERKKSNHFGVCPAGMYFFGHACKMRAFSLGTQLGFFCHSEISSASAGYSPPPDQHQVQQQVPQAPKAISASRPKPRPQTHTVPMNGAPPRPPSAPSQAVAAAIAAAAALPSPWAEKRRVLQVQYPQKIARVPVHVCASVCNCISDFHTHACVTTGSAEATEWSNQADRGTSCSSRGSGGGSGSGP